MKYSILIASVSAVKLDKHLFVPEGNIFIAQDSIGRNFFERPTDDTNVQTKLYGYINQMNGPADFEDLVQLSDIKPGQDIVDENDDGIADDQFGDLAFNAAKFDTYNYPVVMGTAEQVYNTLDGSMPGFRQKYFYDNIPEYDDHYSLIEKPWTKW